jgi:hypothetical protein
MLPGYPRYRKEGEGVTTILNTAPYVVIEKASELTGYTRRAIEEKIAKGIWLEGREWVHAPDGRRLISMKGFEQWVEGKGSMSARRQSGSRSAMAESSIARP